jgi:hypothetical protein
MKKINHIKDIKQEKMRLRIQQLEQEKAIRNNWNEVKEELRPASLLRNKLASLSHTKPEEGRLLPGLLNYGAGYFSRSLTKMAGQKIETTVKQGIEKLMGKINTVLKKK